MRRLLCLLFVVALTLMAVGEVPPGAGAASFARIGIDARPLAMGGAFVAVDVGNPIAYYNPAALVNAPVLGTGGMYSRPYGEEFGITFQSLTILGCLRRVQTDSARAIGAAFTWVQMRISGIPIWGEDDPSVTFFAATSSIYLASIAAPLFDSWAVGVSAKLYRERILEGRGEGLGFDLGLLGSFQINDIPITVGFNATDIGRTTVRWHGTTGEPENYVFWVNKAGVSALLLGAKILVACDVDWAVGRPAREQKVHLGIEARLIQAAAARVGVRSDLEGNVSLAAGIGLHLFDAFDLDYAYVPQEALGATHFVSAHFVF
jgi:hypothetical protein